jgi:hypothetical protein
MNRNQFKRIKKYGAKKNSAVVKTKYIMAFLIIMLISMSIGYSYWNIELDIVGTVIAKSSTADAMKETIIGNETETIDNSYKEGTVISSVTSSGEGGLCTIANPNGSGSIYFFRGDVDNNYVYFAGYTWRILRINSDGSLRIILNSNATTSAYLSIDAAIELMDYKSSTAYSVLQTWYNTNLASYSSYILQSEYLFDTSYTVHSSVAAATGTCYYFGSYTRVGADSTAGISNNTPTFGVDSKYVVTDYIGLITSDEVVYAGGKFNTSNTSFFLNIGSSFWTMSPSFYDGTKKIGFMCVNSTGTLNDWPSSNTLADSLGIRPVITIRGDKSMTGKGTSASPYTYELSSTEG